MNKIKDTKCTLCIKKADGFSVTGIKIVASKEVPYQLCANCCKELQGLSYYSPAESKKRRAFWDRVWDNLQQA